MLSCGRTAVFALFVVIALAVAEADSNSSCDATKNLLHPANILPSMLSAADEALLGQMQHNVDPWMKPAPSPSTDFLTADVHRRRSSSFRERSVKSRAMLSGDTSVISSGSVIRTVPDVSLPHLF
mmetsp:Transcript_21685/g.44070  ORF Transcript_21685/g.44070 Transcript_21685/m.44070 type:complete len:125 (+) Transcript_21685:31-405(+)